MLYNILHYIVVKINHIQLFFNTIFLLLKYIIINIIYKNLMNYIHYNHLYIINIHYFNKNNLIYIQNYFKNLIIK